MGVYLAKSDLMARKTATIVIDADGRDQGKHFLIREMSASQAEAWAARALLALGQSGANIPDGVETMGFAGVMAIGVRAFAGLPWHLAEPLLAEMFGCVSFIPDPARPLIFRGTAPGAVGPMVEDDIEEVATRLRLRDEVIKLHSGFSVSASLSKLREALNKTAEPTGNTSTSPEPSEP